MEFILSLPSLFHSAVIFGTVIMFGAMGEILTEKSGNLNLGVPGLMYLGGIASLATTFVYENLYCGTEGIEPSGFVCLILALISSLVASGLGGLLYSFLTITLKTNQNVCGLTLSIFGVACGNFFGGSLNKLAGGIGQVTVKKTAEVFGANLEGVVKSLDNLTGSLQLGSLIFAYGWLTYIALIIAIVLTFILQKTKLGLELRAVGENTATSDACGINVEKHKYLATTIGAMISGLGGTYFVMCYIKGTWEGQGNLEALGWLAVALVIFATWKPLRTIWGSYLFGVLYWGYFYVPGLNRSTQELFKMLPYIFTLIVLLMVSKRNKKESQPPQGLGMSYFREDR